MLSRKNIVPLSAPIPIAHTTPAAARTNAPPATAIVAVVAAHAGTHVTELRTSPLTRTVVAAAARMTMSGTSTRGVNGTSALSTTRDSARVSAAGHVRPVNQ